MQIIIIDHIQQARNWVNEHKPKRYNYSLMRGVEDNEQESEFMFIMRDGPWMERLRGMKIRSFTSLSRTPLKPEQEY